MAGSDSVVLRCVAKQRLESTWVHLWAWDTMLSDQALKQGRLEDALACTGDEGRSKLR
jgi:hypothetical protein